MFTSGEILFDTILEAPSYPYIHKTYTTAYMLRQTLPQTHAKEFSLRLLIHQGKASSLCDFYICRAEIWGEDYIQSVSWSQEKSMAAESNSENLTHPQLQWEMYLREVYLLDHNI